MGIPSVKTLSSITGIDAERAKKLRALLEKGERHDRTLDAADKIIEGHGVEGLRDGDVRGLDSYHTDEGIRFCPPYSYVNLGDPYLCTLIRDHVRGRWIVGDWGSIVERLSR